MSLEPQFAQEEKKPPSFMYELLSNAYNGWLTAVKFQYYV